MSAATLALRFAGWMQCRLSTDPDPYDELRGVTGRTYALPGEPDLDRVIRFTPANAVVRVLAAPPDVRVTEVRVDGRRTPRHPLVGATLSLGERAVFEGRNGLAALERDEPIFDIDVCVAGAGVVVRRHHVDSRGGAGAVPAAGVLVNDSLLREAGVPDAAAYVADRIERLAELRRAATDPVIVAGLDRRLAGLETRLQNPRVSDLMHQMVMTHRGVISGPVSVEDDADGTCSRIDRDADWPFEVRTGAFDPDTLSGWASGVLAIALR